MGCGFGVGSFEKSVNQRQSLHCWDSVLRLPCEPSTDSKGPGIIIEDICWDGTQVQMKIYQSDDNQHADLSYNCWRSSWHSQWRLKSNSTVQIQRSWPVNWLPSWLLHLRRKYKLLLCYLKTLWILRIYILAIGIENFLRRLLNITLSLSSF